MGRAGLGPTDREVVLVAPTRGLGELRDQHRASHLLHDERLETTETPPIGRNRRWGRHLLDPEEVTELLEQGGQTHRLPPHVRHALRSSMGRGEPAINRPGRRGDWGNRWSLLGSDEAAAG